MGNRASCSASRLWYYLYIFLRGIQVRKFGKAFKQVFGGFTLKGEKAGQKVCPHSSLATAIAAQVGTGNLAVQLQL
ncbi:MAG: hypothetical protein ACLT9Y_01285 [Peptostreptococcus anaerobius]